ncbi:MAG: hypothetical protein ACR2QV_11470 [Gammaproteobacteria bacterium]
MKGRRALIKGAAGALPMILTLQSGAALARSSNLISSASAESAKDQYGRTLCMDGKSVYPVDSGPANVYDMGEPPEAVVSVIRDRKYYIWSEGDGLGQVTTEEMCDRGGYYFVKRRWGWRKVYVKRGMLVSATALSSFAGHIHLIDV